MKNAKKTAMVTILGLVSLVSTSFGSNKTRPTSKVDSQDTTTQRVNVIKSGSAQQKAAAAFWLSQQRSLDAAVIDSLAGLLGDKTLVDSSQYRYIVEERRSTLGEEVALALVRIGPASIQPLIRVLKTSPLPEARKNAAWALGALHENGTTADPNAV
jgi:HEAT repeat protein